MSYEVGTHISFAQETAIPKPQRLYNVGDHVVFIKMIESLNEIVAVHIPVGV